MERDIICWGKSKDWMKNSIDTYIYCIICGIFYIWLASMVPYGGDDWDWGLDIGIQHLLTADINSRYAGNLAVVLMTRSNLVKTLIMGIGYILIPVLMGVFAVNEPWKIEWKRTLILICVCNGLLFTMDLMIWRQTYGWVSGFANYNISVIFLMVYLCKLMPLFRDAVSGKQTTWASDGLLFLMAVIMQLFLENLAAYAVLASAIACFIALIRTRRIGRRYWLLLLGNLIGLMIMFSSKMYISLMETGEALDGVRTLTFYPDGGPVGMLLRCMKMFIQCHVPYIWENNVAICCAIAAVLLCLWQKRGGCGRLFQCFNVLSIVYFILCGQFDLGKTALREAGVLTAVETTVNLGFFFVTGLQTVLLYRKRPWFATALLLMWLSAPVVIAPLAAVDMGIGRIYLTSNVFMIVYLAMLFSDFLKKLSEKTVNRIVAVCLAITIMLFLHYGRVFLEIDACTDTRMKIIEDTRKAQLSEVVLPAYPHSEYLWMIEPSTEERWVYFKEFFEIAPDTNVYIQ